MKNVRITALRKACYPDLIEKYENPIENACDVQQGQVWIAENGEKPEGFCDSAWQSMEAFVETLAQGGGNFYDGWMKNPHCAMISCNDGFRPVSFYLEALPGEAEYLQNPCRVSSIPYWKMLQTAVPAHMQILHGDDFCEEMLAQYTDEPYFRLKHDLRELAPAVLPAGYALRPATAEEMATHIHSCYGNGMTAAQVQAFTQREVYRPWLWLAVCQAETNEIVATGIAELDGKRQEGILEWIQVSAQHRKRGLGSFLVKELLWRMQKEAQFSTVSGQCNNPSNPEGLYRKCGFAGNDVWHVLTKNRG